MSANLHEGRELGDADEAGPDSSPSRPRWIAGLVAVAVVLAALGVVVALAHTRSADAGSAVAGGSGSASPMTGPAYTTTRFQPSFTWNVPASAAGTGVVVSDAPADLSWKPPEGCEPRCTWTGFLSPRSVKQWSTGVVLPVTTAAQYADYLRGMGKGGPIAIRSEKPVTVGGMSGTEFTFDEQAFTPDAFACVDAKATDCYPISSDMTTALVVLDAGGRALLASTSSLSTSPAGDVDRAQFEQALTTLTLRGTAPSAASTFAVTASTLSPALSVRLPSWAETSEKSLEAGAYNYTQTVCGSSPCAPDTGRGIRLYTVHYMYPLNSRTIVTNPSYAAEVAAYQGVQSLGYGTVSDVATTTVDGRPATTLTVALSKEVFGLARCPSATSARTDCAHAVAGRVQRVTIVDNGAGKPVTLLFESWNRSADHDDAAVIAEYDQWLSTVRFAA